MVVLRSQNFVDFLLFGSEHESVNIQEKKEVN